MKALVVGHGSIGRRHVQNLLRADVVEVGVVDPAARARDGVPAEVRWFAGLPDGFRWRPDIVLVCAPTHRHAEITMAALQAGAHVFVEKPLTLQLADADRIVDAQRDVGRQVMVGCNMRFHPGVASLRALIDEGRLGPLELIDAHYGHYLPNWRPGTDYRSVYSARADEGGGVLMDAIHEFDYVDWLGSGIVEVACVGGRVGRLEIDVEDAAVVYGPLAAGGAAIIRVDYLRREKSRGCQVIGQRATARWSSVGKAPEVVTVDALETGAREWKTVLRIDDYDANAMYVAELQHFLRCVREGCPPAVDAARGRRLLAIVLNARDQVARQLRSSPPASRPGGAA